MVSAWNHEYCPDCGREFLDSEFEVHRKREQAEYTFYPSSELVTMHPREIMQKWRPGSYDTVGDAPWTWADEIVDIQTRECACCGEQGHYQRQVKEKLEAEGVWWECATILLGYDGRVWDGHHRIIAALDLDREIPVELVKKEDIEGVPE